MDYKSGPYGQTSGAKAGPGAMSPASATEIQWQYLEPLITSQQLRDRFLFGIPMVSGIRDPITHKPQVMTDDLIKDTINRAVGMVEADTSISIFPQIVREQQPFDRAEYLSWGYFRIMHRPVACVHDLSVMPSTQQSIFRVPPEWICTDGLIDGRIQIVPMTSALGAGAFIPATSAGGATMLMILGSQPWLPAFWCWTVTIGFPDGLVTRVINEIVGTYAAMEVLGMLAASHALVTSQSLGIDSLSQSTSGPGPQMYAQRMTELTAKRDHLKRKVKTIFGMNLFSGNL